LRANGYLTCLLCCLLVAAIFLAAYTTEQRKPQIPSHSALLSESTRTSLAPAQLAAPATRRSPATVSFPLTFEPNVRQAEPAPGSPQTIALQGSATDFCVDPPGLTTQTVTAGTAAAYQVDLVSFTGFTGSVALACTDPTTASICTIQPTSATVMGNTPAPIQENVTTAAGPSATSANPGPPARLPPLTPPPVKMFVVVLMLAVLWTAASVRRWERAAQLAQSVAITALLVVSLAACFGGSSATITTGTPSGTYTLTVIATYTPTGSSTTITRSIPLTLIVQ
jgi:hypothetical protein